jgi:NhaP-type Na+/H+ or K+/H+ antiporter
MSVGLPILLGVVIAATFLGNALSERTRIPDLVYITGMGVLMWRVFGIRPLEAMPASMSAVGIAALAIILFRTGLELDLRRFSRQLGRALLLSLFSFSLAIFLVYTALFVGLDAGGPMAWAIAAALACTSAGLSLPALAKARPSKTLSSLLSMESALTEAIAVILVLVMAGQPKGESMNAAFWLHKILPFLVGGGIAVVTGFLWLWLMRRLDQRRFFYLLTMGWVLLLMGLVEQAGGSGAFAVLVFGLMLANSESILRGLPARLRSGLHAISEDGPTRLAIAESHEQIYFFVRGFFFLNLGILLKWPGSDLRIWLGIVVVAAAVIVAREIAVQLAGWTTGIPGKDRAVLRFASPRGLTTAVLVAILIPSLGSGPWVTVVVAVILISDLWMWLGSAKLSRDKPALGKGD